MPLSYRIYPGHTYEGKTLVDGVEFSRKQIGTDSITVVADAGMLSSSNISLIKELGMSFIISARIRSMDSAVTQKILYPSAHL
jgi:transposase